MVVGAFPIAKLGALLVRQVSKPLAGYIKEGAKRSHVFRNWICLPVAQFYHRCETRYKLWILGLGKPTQITPLNEEMAVNLGADILGESIIFTIAGVLVTGEYIRSSAKAKAHEADQERRLAELEIKLIELDLAHEQQQAQMREMERKMLASPFQVLKDKLSPSTPSGGQPSKSDQRPSSSSSSPSISSSSSSSSVPQWRRPFVGTTTSTKSDTSMKSTSSDDGGASSTHEQTTSKNGMQIGNAEPGTAVHSSVDAARDSEKVSDVMISKAVRRAIKILLNTYEEYEEMDDD